MRYFSYFSVFRYVVDRIKTASDDANLLMSMLIWRKKIISVF